ncbi:Hypothetical predicted protein [Paramuricea clavata]|uniref:Uncharacterized protein n=1 Tax=Paramuricea clavata TaxID=317549 RepID=A0A6S7GN64_PARCT|nr:Hypothetical predicted protein [Paramuricea clavata]
MGVDSGEETHVNEDEKKFEDEINKEISKLKYFLEEADELIENRVYAEMDILDKRAGKIINKLTDIIAQTEELKLDNGTTPRAVRQWKKDVRTKYLSLVEDKEKLTREVKRRQDDLERESEQRQTELEEKRQQQHERRMAELRERQEEHEQEQDSQQLYSLDVLGVEDRGENDQLDVHREFKENIVHDINGRYEGNRLERPLQAICPLEIKSVTAETVEKKKEEPIKPVPERRKAAVDAQAKIQQLAKDDAI